MRHVLCHDQVLSKFADGEWQHHAAKDNINHLLLDHGRSFPCIFAVKAALQGGLHYCFAEDHNGTNMAIGLREFLDNARAIGPYASLSYVYPPQDIQSLEAYHQRFWDALKQLHAIDHSPWPSEIPYALRDPDWTFCFAGEPIFPLCLTPAHARKRTRYSRYFTISFQPRWTFKYHLPNSTVLHKHSTAIQEKITSFDASPISPYLGLYGDGFLDAEKYFLHDENLPMRFPEFLG